MSDEVCFVPGCNNSSMNYPEKVFILLPAKYDIKKKWFDAVNTLFKTTRKMYCCEDHFDLEYDMENYMEFKLMNCKIRMRKGVVPHKSIQSHSDHEDSNLKKRSTVHSSTLCIRSTKTFECVDRLSISRYFQVKIMDEIKEDKNSEKVGDTLTANPTDKEVQVNITPQFRSVGINVRLT